MLYLILATSLHAAEVRWSDTLLKCEKAGVNLSLVFTTMKLCSDAKVSPEKFNKILEPVYSIKDNPTMHALLLEKIEEGVSKGADTKVIISALNKRQKAVTRAQRIIAHLHRKESLDNLISSITYALESGLTVSTVTEIVQYGSKITADKLRAAVDSAEFLYLAGVDEKKIINLMKKLIDKKLSRSDIKKIAAERSKEQTQ